MNSENIRNNFYVLNEYSLDAERADFDASSLMNNPNTPECTILTFLNISDWLFENRFSLFENRPSSWIFMDNKVSKTGFVSFVVILNSEFLMLPLATKADAFNKI